MQIAWYAASRTAKQLDRFAGSRSTSLFFGLLGQETEALVRANPRSFPESPSR